MNLIFLCVVATQLTSLVSAQVLQGDEAPVLKSDPVYPILEEYRNTRQVALEKSGAIVTTFGEWRASKLPSFAKFFPNLRFATISYTMKSNPRGKEHVAGLPAGAIEETLVIDPKTARIVAGEGGNRVEDVADLLVRHRVRITNAGDADLVWEAFAELNHVNISGGPPPKWPSVKVSETEWHVGNSTWQEVHHYVQVILDADHVVKSVTRHTEKVPIRQGR